MPAYVPVNVNVSTAFAPARKCAAQPPGRKMSSVQSSSSPLATMFVGSLTSII